MHCAVCGTLETVLVTKKTALSSQELRLSIRNGILNDENERQYLISSQVNESGEYLLLGNCVNRVNKSE